MFVHSPNLIALNEFFTNGYRIEILDIFFLFAVLFAISVIVVKNPIVSLLCLIGLFTAVSLYLIIIDVKFIGLSYLIVYVGAVSILFLFILMLINVRTSELQSIFSNIIALAISIIISFNYSLFELLPDNILLKHLFLKKDSYFYTDSDVLLVTGQTWDSYITNVSDITSIGNILYTNYNIWLIISSYILLLSMTGVIVITIKSK